MPVPLPLPSKQDLLAYTFDVAKVTQVPARELIKIIDCESRWKPDAVSPTHDRGLVQINAQAHPEIAPEQAFDPYFSIQYLATAIHEGQAHQWTCARLLGY